MTTHNSFRFGVTGHGSPATVPYRITVMDPSDGQTTYREIKATDLSEALTMAERMDAGQHTYIYGIDPSDYAEAVDQDIHFNTADGLLVEDLTRDDAADDDR